MRIWLSRKSFIYLALLVFVWVLYSIFSWILPGGIILTIVFALMFFLDYRTLPPEDSFSLTFESKRNAKLKDRHEVIVILSSTNSLSSLTNIFVNSDFIDLGKVNRQVKSSKQGIFIDDHQIQQSFIFQCEKLGFFESKPVRVTLVSKLGLLLSPLAIRAPLAIKVSPSERSPDQDQFQEIVRDQNLIMSGNKKIVRNRRPEIFRSFAEYRRGDPFKLIDHKKSAQLGHFVVREYDNEMNHHLVLALDLGRGMDGYVGESRKIDYYFSVILSLAEQAIKVGDKVSFIAFAGDIVHFSGETRNLDDFQMLYQNKEFLNYRLEESSFLNLNELIRTHIRQRSIIFVFSEFTRSSIQDVVKENLADVFNRHLCALLCLIDDQFHHTEILRQIHEQPELREYLKLLYSYQLEADYQQFSANINSQGGMAVKIPGDFWISASKKIFSELRQSFRA